MLFNLQSTNSLQINGEIVDLSRFFSILAQSWTEWKNIFGEQKVNISSIPAKSCIRLPTFLSSQKAVNEKAAPGACGPGGTRVGIACKRGYAPSAGQSAALPTFASLHSAGRARARPTLGHTDN